MTDHETMIISALRYALPRRSYIMSSTEEYIRGMKKLSRQFIEVARGDIEDFLKESHEELQYDWKPLLAYLRDLDESSS